jgi:hypothetical protein
MINQVMMNDRTHEGPATWRKKWMRILALALPIGRLCEVTQSEAIMELL